MSSHASTLPNESEKTCLRPIGRAGLPRFAGPCITARTLSVPLRAGLAHRYIELIARQAISTATTSCTTISWTFRFRAPRRIDSSLFSF
jgi:hypothetical protein